MDEALHTDTPKFHKMFKGTIDNFDTSDDATIRIPVTLFTIERGFYNIVKVNQNLYSCILKNVLLDAGVDHFRYMRIRLSQMSIIRPRCLFYIFQLAQVTFDTFKSKGLINFKY